MQESLGRRVEKLSLQFQETKKSALAFRTKIANFSAVEVKAKHFGLTIASVVLTPQFL